MLDEQNPNLKTAYDQLCVSYRAIDDFRAKLLGFLPLATGGGVFYLLSNQATVRKEFFLPVGIFGMVVTAGLFAYEIFGIRKCAELIEAGRRLEGDMSLPAGQFVARPDAVVGILDEPFAAGVIYPAVLAAWTYLALVYRHGPPALGTAIVVFVVGLVLTVLFGLFLRCRRKGGASTGTEPARTVSQTPSAA